MIFKLDKKAFKQSIGYKKYTNPVLVRIVSIYHILTDKNFILITGIKEFSENGESCRKIQVIRRTDYSRESDYLSCIGASEICNPKK